MKKIIAILLAVMMLGAIACTAKTSVGQPKNEEVNELPPETAADTTADNTESNAGNIELPELSAGGWTVVGDGKAQLPEEGEAAFKAVMENLVGATYEPVAFLGSQVVAGTNYSILCTRTLVTANPVTDLAVLTIYRDLEGNAQLLNVADFDIGTYAQAEDSGAPEQLMGGWYAPETAEAMNAMPEKAATAYAQALEGFVGNKLTPVALLGTQLVAGTNYAFLCHSKLVTLEPVYSMQLVVIYADLQGNATITNIVTINPADFN